MVYMSIAVSHKINKSTYISVFCNKLKTVQQVYKKENYRVKVSFQNR